MPHAHHIHHQKRKGWEEEVPDFVESVFGDNPFQKKSPSTIYRTVYKTMDPTFSGSVAGYTTIGAPVRATTTASPSPTDSEDDSDDDNTTSTDEASSETSSSVPASVSSPRSTGALPTTLLTQSQSSSSATLESITGSSTSSSATATSTSTSDSSEGSSGAAKAGIAIGVLAGVLAVFVIVWLVMKKRRKQDDNQRLEDDEKINGPFADTRASINTTRTTPNAPRISLRPVTQFLPNLDKRTSKGANIALNAAPSSPMRSPGQSAWERPMTAESNSVHNPFSDHAERVATPVYDENASRPVTPATTRSTAADTALNVPLPASPSSTAPGSPERAVNDTGAADVVPGTATNTAADVAAVGTAVSAVGAVAAASLTRKTSMRKDGPKQLDLTVAIKGPSMSPVPPSPANTEFSVHSVASGQPVVQSQGAAAIAAAGGPANSTVHRVQLDFAPTLEDELELKAGQLVRLLHEYDDGWALCIRLDRSKQGVVPRTCLSARPVKPRPQQNGPRPGPPVNPQGPGNRGPGPQGRPPMSPMGPGGQPRPMSPANRAAPPANRPQSPAGRPISPYRPQSPAGPPQSPAGVRSQSPGPQQRAQSPSAMNRRNNPPGPSPMNPQQQQQQPAPQQQQHQIERKPVPGQAY